MLCGLTSKVGLIVAAALGGAGCLGMHTSSRRLPEPAPGAGTLASAQLQQPVSTDRSRAGDRFTLELLDPVVDADGREVIGRGAVLEGVVRRGGAEEAVEGLAPLSLELVGVRVAGEGLVPIHAEVAYAPVEESSGWGRGFVGAFAGATAGSGAGLVIDRDSAGTVVGSALLGAGVGALVGALLAPDDAEVPAGSILTLRFGGDLRAFRALPGARGLVLAAPADRTSTPPRASEPAGHEVR